MHMCGQTGMITGTVSDELTGEPIMFGTVVIKENPQSGTNTDLDGKFSIEAAPGVYTLEFSYIGMSTTIVTEVKVVAGSTEIVNVNMKEDAEILEEIVVKAKAARNTEIALATLKRNSGNVIDGITSSTFSKIGDSDAASAMKRVTGVSVEGGKYVYVRGLGDRYTKSTLNGMEVPGLDPDRNALQMDIFPTSILDNILVLKSFTADLPADFTGGIVNISTKDFPESRGGSVSLGVSYNPSMHLKSDFLTSSTSNTDFLGFDNRLRSIPTGKSLNIPFRTNALADPQNAGVKYASILNGFNPNMAVYTTNNYMDYSLGFSIGNHHHFTKNTLGYNFAISYQNSTEFYKNAEFNVFGKSRDLSTCALEQRSTQVGDFTTSQALLAGIAGITFKTTASKISLNLLHIQNGEAKNGIFDYNSTFLGSNFIAFQHNIEYSERRISNALLKGVHTFKRGKWQVQWNLSPTLSSIYDPDIRMVRYRTDGNSLTIGTESGIPSRTWRFLDEVNLNGNAHTDMNYSHLGKNAKLKFGVAATLKTRDYEIQSFQIYANGITLTGNPDELFYTSNLWSSENPNGVSYDPQFIPFNTNKFSSSSNNYAAFISNEMYVFSKFKTILGLRAENFQQFYTGRNQSGESFRNKEVFNKLNLFPTANLIYELVANQNIRASYSRTIARPSFKESSFATIADPISGRTFIGGFFPDIDVTTGETIWDGNLVSTDIDNFDLRWERFGESGQLISISGFYKSFKNPIEIVQYVQAAGNFQPRNVGNGTVKGIELEVIKNMSFLGEFGSQIMLNLNTTLTTSSLEISASELKSRQLTAREGQEISKYRQMAGQAPYLVNTGISYKGKNSQLEVGMYYNMQGKTLKYAGISDRPDVYARPFHSLNLSINLPLSNQSRYNMGLRVSNILNSKREEVFSSYNTQDETFSSLAPGRAISFKIGCRF